MKYKVLLFISLIFLTNCSSDSDPTTSSWEMSDSYTLCHKKFAKKAYNKPYTIKGIDYHPQAHYELSEIGMASYYGGTDIFHGRKTSNGEIFDMDRISVAHKTLPIPCIVRITNLENNRSIKAKVNDRGPFWDERVVDVSRKIAQLLGFYHKGTAKIHIETVVPDTLKLVHGHLDPEELQDADVTEHFPLLPGAASTNEETSIYSDSEETGVISRLESEVTSHTKQPDIYIESSRPVKTAKSKNENEFYLEPNSLKQKRSDDNFIDKTLTDFDNPKIIKPKPVLPSKNKTKILSKTSVASKKQKFSSLISGDRGYFIETDTYREEKIALKVRQKLQNIFPPQSIRLEKVSFGRTTLIRILIGPFRHSQDAKTLLKKITAVGFENASVLFYQ